MTLEVDRTGTIFLVSSDDNGDHRIPYSPGGWVRPEGQDAQFVATDISSLPDGARELAQKVWTPEIVASFQDATAPAVQIAESLQAEGSVDVGAVATLVDDVPTLRKDIDALTARIAALEAKAG